MPAISRDAATPQGVLVLEAIARVRIVITLCLLYAMHVLVRARKRHQQLFFQPRHQSLDMTLNAAITGFGARGVVPLRQFLRADRGEVGQSCKASVKASVVVTGRGAAVPAPQHAGIAVN